MSTEGCGKAGLAMASPIIAGVGVGVLLGQGIMWCGDQMVAYIERKEQEYADLLEEAKNSSRKNVDQLRSRLFTKMKQIAIDDTGADAELSLAKQETLLWSMTQARAALADTDNQRDTVQTVERRSLTAQLKFDLEFHRAILPPALID